MALPSPPRRTVVDAVLERSDAGDGAVALRWIAAAGQCVDVTYHALVRAALAAAACFPPFPLGSGGRASCSSSSSPSASASPPCVGIMVEEGPVLAVLELAVMVAGYALVPLSPRDPLSRLRFVLEDADLRVAVVPDKAAAACLCEAQTTPFPILLAADVVDIDSLANDNSGNYTTTTATNTTTTNNNNNNNNNAASQPNLQLPLCLPSADAVSHIFFTSGSTGKPKGCLATHAALLSYCRAKNDAHGIDASSVVFVASPHTFDPSLGDFFATWVAGGTAACAPRADTFAALGRCLIDSKCTHCLTTPALLGTMPAGPPARLRLQVVALGGEVTPRALLSAWAPHADRILNTYGTTECVVYQTCAVLHDAMDGGAVTDDPRRLGQPLAGNTLHFVAEPGDDPAKLAVEGSGELAELWIGGAQVGLGYLNRPELTRTRFQHHPPPQLAPQGGGAGGRDLRVQQPKPSVPSFLFRTGDIVQMAPGGPLLLGRRDAQVKLNGQRVELGEVEAGLLRAAGPGLLQSVAAVALKPTGTGSKIAARLVAWCVPGWTEEEAGDTGAASSRGGGRRPDIEVPALYHDALRWLAGRELPRHMVPSQLGFLASLPLTGTGKVARRPLLRRGTPIPPPQEASPEGHGVRKAHGAVGEAVSRIWSDVLGLPTHLHGEYGARRLHFLEMGGDSLAALRACQRLSALLAEAAPVESGGANSSTTTFAGEAMGCLGPAELLKRPLLADYVRYLRQEVACWPASLVEKEAGHTTERGGEQKGAKDKDDGDDDGEDEGLRLLYGAAAAGAARLVSRLIECGLPVDGGSYSLTPLHAACANGHAETAQALLAAGALCNAPNSHGATPLLLAAGAVAQGKMTLGTGKKNKAKSGCAGVLSLVLCLLEAGASLGHTDSSGQSVLHAAARSGQSRAVMNALLQAVQAQRGSRARALSAKGPMPLWKDKWGRTPLHWAAVNGHRGCCAYLFCECESAGTMSAKVRDGAGETPLDAAERRALCSAAARPDGARSSVWGDIATLLGGAGTTKHLKAKLKH